jgi:pimeloyl-ACP methyl ester carboxylesterase
LAGEWAGSAARAWGSGAIFGGWVPSMAGSARYREWASRMEWHTCSPGSVEALCRWAAAIDVRLLLAGLRLPVLLIHRQGDSAVPASDGRYLAGHIPGAGYAGLPGEDHALIAAGMTSSEVAARLRVSPHTVDGRLRRVYAKLGVHTRVELTAGYARVTG